MTQKRLVSFAANALAGAAGIAGGAYAAYAAATWLRYGRARRSPSGDDDSLLYLFMPICEVDERHETRVLAPANVTFAAACEADPGHSSIVRAIFKGRALALGSHPDAVARPRGIVALTKSLGWGVLAEIPGSEIVMGAVTQPWKADLVFRALEPAAFAAFDEPGYVKIAWTLRADGVSDSQSIARTETRVMTTDPIARAKFRRYWALFSPGVMLIRRILLRQTRREAERRAQARRTADRLDLVPAGDLDSEC